MHILYENVKLDLQKQRMQKLVIVERLRGNHTMETGMYSKFTPSGVVTKQDFEMQFFLEASVLEAPV
jgi:hypothetical protein